MNHEDWDDETGPGWMTGGELITCLAVMAVIAGIVAWLI